MKKYNKKDYPYIAIFKVLPEKISSPKMSEEEVKEAIEEWRQSLKNGWNIIDSSSSPPSEDIFMQQYITKDVKDFVDAVANIEGSSNYKEKFYVINELKFQIVKNEVL